MSISRYLEREGMGNVLVSFATGEVTFDLAGGKSAEKVLEGIDRLGYRVIRPESKEGTGGFLPTLTAKFIFCLIFTLPLLLHMLLPWPLLSNPFFQLALCLPVYIVGMMHFGRSGLRSLIHGVPNMDVLISLGATAAFVYSLIGTLGGLGAHYLFYETAAAILTLVLLGNVMEEKSVRQTTSAISELARMQQTTARLILPATGEIRELANEKLLVGDCVLVNTGDQIPMDGRIYWGEGLVNEAMVTGESQPVTRKENDPVIGGTLLEQGSLKVRVTATGSQTVLSQIIALVKQAQASKSSMQRLADRISAIFVPVVTAISLLTFLLSFFVFSIPFSDAIMRSIAVLVIACPCAMGLATPAAVMVGLGRAARNGILIKGAHTLEHFQHIRQVVFDKTGTLTTGRPSVSSWKVTEGTAEEFQKIVYSLEKHSSHPVARAVTSSWKDIGELDLQEVREIRGAGLEASDALGNFYQVGSSALSGNGHEAPGHAIYVHKNGRLLGWADTEDTLRADAGETIRTLKAKGIKTILLSGDRSDKCQEIAEKLGIDEVHAEQRPEQKMALLHHLRAAGPTAMIGDGINDAPALTLADIGISLSDASQVAIQSADVVILGGHLGNLPLALALGKHTFLTIRQNLFWAFFYNVIAIPVAALGWLSPILGAAVMALSDVVLAFNSIRLKYKKID
jgi:Cu+-exporting ATPase